MTDAAGLLGKTDDRLQDASVDSTRAMPIAWQVGDVLDQISNARGHHRFSTRALTASDLHTDRAVDECMI